MSEYAWWNMDEHKIDYPLPLSIIQEGDVWVATFHPDSKKILGDNFDLVSQGETKEEAIKELFALARFAMEYTHETMLSSERWVPFKVGSWNGTATHWFVVFGIHFNFRYGKEMQGGVYIPFTLLNISISNTWKTYANYKKKKKHDNNKIS